MILECPECRTRYTIDTDRISADGTKVRCSRCSHVFTAYPGTEAESEPSEPEESLSATHAEPELPEPETEAEAAAKDEELDDLDDEDFLAGLGDLGLDDLDDLGDEPETGTDRSGLSADDLGFDDAFLEDDDLFGPKNTAKDDTSNNDADLFDAFDDMDDVVSPIASAPAQASAEDTPSGSDDKDIFGDPEQPAKDEAAEAPWAEEAGSSEESQASQEPVEADTPPERDEADTPPERDEAEEPAESEGAVSYNLDTPSGAALPGEEETPRKGGGRWLPTLLLLLLLVLGGGAAAVWFLDLAGSLPAWVPPEVRELLTRPQQAEPLSREQQVRLISLENVRQYTVANEKIGQVFVIEGRAVNNFPTPKELIKVEVSLYDDKGNEVARKELLGGNTVSLFQLQIMSQAEIEAELASDVGVLSNNVDLASGSSVAFMAVFYNPPEVVTEYGVKVVEALDPQ